MYKVYFLDGYEITGVEDVQFGHERDVTIHDGLGIGKFPTPEAKDLKSWTIKTEQNNNKLFRLLEILLDNKDPSRLVIVSDSEKISEQVLLMSYDKSETYSGTYDVTIKFVEYKEAKARTTDIPTVTRSGKMPKPPKTVVINNSNNTAFKAAEKAVKAAKTSEGTAYEKLSLLKMEFLEKDTGKPVNPCLVEKDKEYNIEGKKPKSIVGSISAWFNAEIKKENSIEQNNAAIDKAYREWEEKWQKKK